MARGEGLMKFDPKTQTKIRVNFERGLSYSEKEKLLIDSAKFAKRRKEADIKIDFIKVNLNSGVIIFQ
jgi:hypothetical protein